MSNMTGQTEFHVAKGEESFGPWTIDEIAERLGRGEIALTDFVYDDVRGDWIPLMECQALKERLNKSKPKAPPPPPKAKVGAGTTASATTTAPTPEAKATQPGDEGAQWFVQKGTHRYGPFTYMGLVRALQEKTVYEFDFVWQQGMESWVRLAEHELFQPEKIRELAQTAAYMGEVLIKRQRPRHSFESEVIVHDDRSVWMGRVFEASSGGSGLTIENATLQPGQVVRLHFASTDKLPAFNALGEIVGKKFSKDVRDAKSPVTYAVRFLSINGSAENSVREYFEKNRRNEQSA